MELSVAEYKGEYPTTAELIQFHRNIHRRQRDGSDRLVGQIERLLMASDLGRSYLSKIREAHAGLISVPETVVTPTQVRDHVMERSNDEEERPLAPQQLEPSRSKSPTFVWGIAALSVGFVLCRRVYRFRLGERERLELLKTFGLGPQAGREDVKRAFRLQAKSTHPDMKGTTEEFDALHRKYRRLLEITKP